MKQGRIEANARLLHLEADLVVPQGLVVVARAPPEGGGVVGGAQGYVERVVGAAEAETLRGLGIPGRTRRHLVRQQHTRAVAVRFRLVELVVPVGEQAARMEGALFLVIVVAQSRRS